MSNPVAGIASTYERRLGELRTELAQKERRHFWFSQCRLAVAAGAVAILLFGGLRALAFELVPLGLFVLTAYLHAKLLNARDAIASAIAFYERGLRRIRGEWMGHGRSGERHRQPEHLYAEDLDIFGRGSIFELLATTRTEAGESTLVQWLLHPAPPDVVAARQHAVQELIPRLEIREEIAVLGDGIRVGVNSAMLREWVARPRRLTGRTPRVLLGAMSGLSVFVIGLWATTGFTPVLVAVALVAQGLIARWLQPRVLEVIESVASPSHDLDLLVGLVRVLERERFTCPTLQAIGKRVQTTGRPASAEIGRLAQMVGLLESRANVIAAVPAALMMWATQSAYAIESWRGRAGTHVPEWLDAVAEFETLLALATFAAEHPDYVFPQIAAAPAFIRAERMAHPVLPPTAVANDLDLRSDGVGLIILSGSNMSGKSTLLRTLGVNLVLAEMGAPVRARAFACSDLAIGASIRVQDSLTDGRSRFFAEITRLKRIVDLAHAHPSATLFLFDEILGGTNSHDRRVGAEQLAVGLVNIGAIGILTTHDLALGEIADRLPGRAENLHFEDRFEAGVLTFDYTLRKGIVRTSNALELMRAVGLKI